MLTMVSEAFSIVRKTKTLTRSDYENVKNYGLLIQH